MANKRIIFLKNNEALIKVDGAVGTVTIDLDVDLLGANEALDGQTPAVNITAVTWSGDSTGTISITRGGTKLISMNSNPPGHLGGAQSFIENGNNTADVVVTTATAEAQVWIRLHKVAGFRTRYESEQFGSYDNPSTVGS